VRASPTSDREARRPRVAVVGGYGMGLTFLADRVPLAGETVVGRSFQASHGGKASNQAIAAARLGAEVALLTAVGDDAYGRAARELWVEEGVDASAVRTVNAATMVGAVLVEANGENRILIVPGALEHLEVNDAEDFEPLIAAADVILVSLEIPLGVATRVCQLGRAHGRPVILNPAPAMALPAALLVTIDYLVPNRLESARIAGLPEDAEPADLLAALLALTPATVVMTLGRDGALMGRRRSDPLHIPTPATAVVDTTGAGDAFSGALAVALAEGVGVETATRFAVLAGSSAVTVAEAVPSLPRRRDLGDPTRARRLR
jgi:ribokinase